MTGIYSITTNIQNNTLLNRGILDIGGIGIPQALMSNNKDEAIERGSQSLLYFGMSFLTPFFMLPLFNKRALKSTGIVKNFQNNEKRILEVSKKYLTKDADFMEKGIKITAKNLKTECDFQNILNRFNNKEELRQKLLEAHHKIFRNDFLSTAWMWCATPWIITEATERRTNKKGFSATYEMRENNVDDEKYKQNKIKKMIGTALIATIPAILIPRVVTKNMANGKLAKYADCFDYTGAKFMSKTIFALMWGLVDYPNQLIQSRDKNELKDRAIRYGAMVAMFFGGDLAFNYILGKTSDKLFNTKVMNKNVLKSFKDIEKLEGNVLRRTKYAGIGIYWASLLANVALLGVGLPGFLNFMLKKDIAKEQNIETKQYLTMENFIKNKTIKNS